MPARSLDPWIAERAWLWIALGAFVLAACAQNFAVRGSAGAESGERAPLGEVQAAARTGREIVVGGRYFDVGTPVVLWNDDAGYDAYREEPGQLPGLAVAAVPAGRRYGSRAGLKSRALEDLREQIGQFVLHYDVAVVSRRCFQILHERRGLSVHFLLDADGTIYQTLDLAERAWHASSANDHSVGIEIAHIGAYPSPGHPEVQKVYSRDHLGWFLDLPDWIGDSGFRSRGFVARPRTEGFHSAHIHGREVHQLDYTPEQYAALARLCEGLHRVLGIPLEAPRDTDGQVLHEALDNDALARFRGVLGHWHVQTNKVDPGPALDWDFLLEQAKALSR